MFRGGISVKTSKTYLIRSNIRIYKINLHKMNRLCFEYITFNFSTSLCVSKPRYLFFFPLKTQKIRMPLFRWGLNDEWNPGREYFFLPPKSIIHSSADEAFAVKMNQLTDARKADSDINWYSDEVHKPFSWNVAKSKIFDFQALCFAYVLTQ